MLQHSSVLHLPRNTLQSFTKTILCDVQWLFSYIGCVIPRHTILHKDAPACDVAGGPCGEGVRGGRDAHRLHQVVEEDGSAELE